MCTFVVCFKWGAGRWLFVPDFLKGSYDGADVLTTRVNSSYLGFCGGSDYIFERLAKYVDRSVDAFRVINPSEVVIGSDAAARFGLHEVSGLGRYLEYHVAGIEAKTVGVYIDGRHSCSIITTLE